MDKHQPSPYHCIECGEINQDLYKELKSGIIKVSFCAECGRITDKYILCDPVIMLLDAILHKPQVYRHLLHNIRIPSPWKLFIMFLLCDTYLKWVNLRSSKTGREESAVEINPVFYAALEVDFYKMFCVALSEWICFTLILLGSLKIILTKSVSPKSLLQAVIISSFGKLLVIPAIIWGQVHSHNYLWLTQLFVFTSNMTALRVLCNSTRLLMTNVVALAWVSQYTLGSYITEFVVLL